MDIEELVKATAEAVATLSALVEGLPRAMDTKLAAYTKSLDDTVREMNVQFVSIKAAQAELTDQFKVATQTLVESMGEQAAKTDQIIADNLATSLAQATERSAEVAAMLVKAEHGLVAMLEGSQAETKALRENLGSEIQEVRALLDGVNTQLPTFAPLITVTELRESLGHVSTRVADVQTQVNTVDTKSLAAVEELQGQLAAMPAKLEEIAFVKAEEVGTTVMAKVDEQVASLTEQITHVNTRAFAVDQRQKEFTDTVQTQLAGIPLQIETAAAVTRTQALEHANIAAQQAHDDLEKVAGGIGERFAKVDDFIATISQGQLNLADADKELRAEAMGAIGEVRAFLEGLETQTRALVEGLETRISETDERALANISAVRQAVTNADSAMREAIDNAEKLAAEGDRALDLELRGYIGASAATAKAALSDLTQTVQEAIAAVAEVRAVAVSKASADTVELLANEHHALCAKFMELPEPINATELEVRLANKLVELIPEHTTMELPAPDIDAAFNGNELMVTLTMGEKTVVAKRTIPMGLVYRGVYEKGEDYDTGNFVTYKGSMWYAKSPPKGEPGKDLLGWQLAVKCGRDGKDAVPPRAYDGHENGRTYKEADFLRLNNRLWQCAVKDTGVVPEPGDITSTREWTLIGGVH